MTAVHESGRSVDACHLASEVYQLTRSVLKYLGRTDLCGLDADRAVRYAEETEDPTNVNTLFFGPANVGIHRVRVEYESGEIGEALRLSNDVDISRTPSVERKNSLLTKVAQCYECKGNDTAVLCT